MGWSMDNVMCGNKFLGYLYESVGGHLDAAHCGNVQQQHLAQQINQPGKPFVCAYSPQQILAKADDNGFVYPDSYSNYDTHMQGQCVSLVRGVIPALDVHTSHWCKGEDLTPANIVKLTPGTAIGYGFKDDGRYASNKTGNHVAIFVSASADGTKIDIIDQWHHKATEDKPEKFQAASPHSKSLQDEDWAVLTLCADGVPNP